jgi:hypothetical protein
MPNLTLTYTHAYTRKSRPRSWTKEGQAACARVFKQDLALVPYRFTKTRACSHGIHACAGEQGSMFPHHPQAGCLLLFRHISARQGRVHRRRLIGEEYQALQVRAERRACRHFSLYVCACMPRAVLCVGSVCVRLHGSARACISVGMYVHLRARLF